MSEPERSLLFEGRLIAYVYSDAGEARAGVQRAGSDGLLAALNQGKIETFSAEHEPLLKKLAEKKPELEEFLFVAQLEGFELREGRVRPNSMLRRF